MVSKKVMVKKENLVTYRMLGVGMMLNYIEFLKVDYVFARNYPNAMVWKDLGHDFALGDEIPMNGTLPKSNNKVRIPFAARRSGQLVSLISHKPNSVYTSRDVKKIRATDTCG